MRIKTLLAISAVVLSTAVMARDNTGRQMQLVGDSDWLKSTECSVPNVVVIPGVGVIEDQCELERMLKNRLNPDQGTKSTAGGI
jgi:uncharacterized membrane protein YcjF (UPF0283 family)